MTLGFVALLVAAYLLGAIPFGVLVCRAKGIDLFSFGSGNIGATNVYRAVGGKLAAVVFVADVGKGLVPTLVARHFFPESEVQWMVAGAAATLGHVFSPFLKFKGGKGVACLLGMVLGVSLYISAWTLVVFIVIVGLTRYVSLGSIIAVPTSAVVSLATGQKPAVTILFTAVSILTVVMHRKNIVRLMNGTENKLGKKKPSIDDEPSDPPLTDDAEEAVAPNSPKRPN